MNYNKCEEISIWLNEYLKSSGMQCFVIGVSGGVDSAVASTLAAMTGVKTLVVNIPIQSTEKNTSLSTQHCEWLCSKFSNVESFYIEATDAYTSFEECMNSHGFKSNLSKANSKSRMRMMALYYIASANRGLVVGTGNKVEDFGVGFYTKYGDGGVDISPIADLTKTQVRLAAKSLGISQSILDAPPTDGLWEDSRSDEEQIGASYEELEWAMDYIDNNKSTSTTNREKEVLKIFESFRNQNRHKMVEIPVYQMEKGQ